MSSSQKSSSRSAGRIVLGLVATSEVERSVLTAITLAKAIEREIIGLFVIEEEMMEIAALPFTSTLETSTARRLELTPHIMSKALDRGATHCKQSLSNESRRADVSCSFSIENGNFSHQLGATILEGDYLILSGGTYEFDGPHLLDQFHFIPNQVEGLVIAPPKSSKRPDGPVIVLDEGNASGENILSLAFRIAQATSQELILLVLARSEEQAKLISNRATNMLPREQKLTIHRLIPGAVDALKTIFTQLSPSYVIADMQSEPFANNQTAQPLIRAAQAPVILLRA